MHAFLRRALCSVLLALPLVGTMAQNAGPDRIVLLGTKGGPSVRDHHSFPSSNVLVLGGKALVVDAGYLVATPWQAYGGLRSA